MVKLLSHPISLPFLCCDVVAGNHYMYGAGQNFTRAMEYLLKAAAHRSDDAHFSLAMLYRCVAFINLP